MNRKTLALCTLLSYSFLGALNNDCAIQEALKKHKEEKEKANSDLLRAGIAAGSAVALTAIAGHIIHNLGPNTKEYMHCTKSKLTGHSYADTTGFFVFVADVCLALYATVKATQAGKHYFFPNHPEPKKSQC